jgi:hypothetical protein
VRERGAAADGRGHRGQGAVALRSTQMVALVITI